LNNQGFFVKRDKEYSGPHESLKEARTDAGHGTNLPIYHGILDENGNFKGKIIPKCPRQ